MMAQDAKDYFLYALRKCADLRGEVQAELLDDGVLHSSRWLNYIDFHDMLLGPLRRPAI